ncbi:B- and T-lymphocyte attenuator-like [Ambystoma mexicanum]|uniref:B- and T-lymphocyte attenuator-like n=1 Tax=Ambystoma mexicanum TaxID=8296 RepID=UPI0037E818D2
MSRRHLLIRWVSALVHFFAQVYGDETACVEGVQLARQSHSRTEGEALQLNCPVKYCAGARPHVTWCKLHGNYCRALQEEPGRVTTIWADGTETSNSGLYVLTLILVHSNDSGNYRCVADNSKGEKSVSHSIKVTVTAGQVTQPGNHTMPSPHGVMTNVNWKVYVFAILGTLCLVIMMCSLLLLYFRRKEKQEISDGTLHAGTNGVIGAVPPSPSVIYPSSHNMQESANYSSMIGLPQNPPNEMVYDSDNSPSWECNATGPAPSNHDSDGTCNGASADNGGVLVYAALNYSENGSRHFRDAQRPEMELTEYAAICMKN